MQHRKVKSIAILMHSDETQFYICSTNEKVCNHDYATKYLLTVKMKKKTIIYLKKYSEF